MERLALPTERKVWEVEHGTVIFALKGERLPSFFTLLLDQYGYQREWSIDRRIKLEPGKEKTPCLSHMYRHSGVRMVHDLSIKACQLLMEQFHYLLENHPTLLFNATGDHAINKARPRHEGFVHFSERVLQGEVPQGEMF